MHTPSGNPHLHWILESIRLFRAGELDIVGAGSSIAAEAGAIEGDVPKPVREAIERAVNNLDSIYWTTGDAAAADRVLSEVEEVIARYYPSQD
jgi:hypothetical protein